MTDPLSAEHYDTLVSGMPSAGVAARFRVGLHYLATPYSKLAVDERGAWCPVRSLEAAMAADGWAAKLALEGVTAISPISQAASMVQIVGPDVLDPLDDVFWTRWCAPLLAACASVIVPPIAGWRDSAGIRREMAAARDTNTPIYFIASDGELILEAT